MAEQIALLGIESVIESIGNYQIAVEPTVDAQLGYRMWGAKDGAGGVTRFLAKNKPASVTSLNLTALAGGGTQVIKVDNNGLVIVEALTGAEVPDHDNLNGLPGTDPHTQYILNDGDRTSVDMRWVAKNPTGAFLEVYDTGGTPGVDNPMLFMSKTYMLSRDPSVAANHFWVDWNPTPTTAFLSLSNSSGTGTSFSVTLDASGNSIMQMTSSSEVVVFNTLAASRVPSGFKIGTIASEAALTLEAGQVDAPQIHFFDATATPIAAGFVGGMWREGDSLKYKATWGEVDITYGGSSVLLGNSSGINEAVVTNKVIVDNQSRTADTCNVNSIIYGTMAATPAAQTLNLNANVSINNAFTFPIVDGANLQVMSTDGAGNLSWNTFSLTALSSTSVGTAGQTFTLDAASSMIIEDSTGTDLITADGTNTGVLIGPLGSFYDTSTICEVGVNIASPIRFVLSNTTAGTGAYIHQRIRSDSANLNFYAFSTTYTGSAQYQPDYSVIDAESGGLIIATDSANEIRIYTNALETARFFSGGGLAVGTTSLTDVNTIAEFQIDQNNSTKVVAHNATSGTSAHVGFVAQASSVSGALFAFSTGYTTSNQYEADAVLLEADSGNLNISALGSNEINFYSSSLKRVTFDDTGATFELGILRVKERTTPTAVPDYGVFYTKADNKAYFQDGAGVEHEIAFV